MELESFLKDKYPDILNEFNVLQEAENKKAKEKEELERETVRKTDHFWNHEYAYDIQYSYKGFTDGEDTETLSFKFAFSLLTDCEFGRTLAILTQIDENFEKGETFDQILKEAKISEDAFKEKFREFLYKSDYTCIEDYVDNKHDWQSRVSSEIVWTGQYYWDESHFEEVWNELKSLHFIECEVKED